LMKLCYLLQEVKRVPLGYSFALYSYGPFDSDVLSDLQTAQELHVLASSVVQYPSGYGYNISQSSNADKVKNAAEEFLTKYDKEITEIARDYASKTAAELELITTVLFVSRDSVSISDSSLASIVRSIKPRFSQNEIETKIVWLREQNLLKPVASV